MQSVLALNHTTVNNVASSAQQMHQGDPDALLHNSSHGTLNNHFGLATPKEPGRDKQAQGFARAGPSLSAPVTQAAWDRIL